MVGWGAASLCSACGGAKDAPADAGLATSGNADNTTGPAAGSDGPLPSTSDGSSSGSTTSSEGSASVESSATGSGGCFAAWDDIPDLSLAVGVPVNFDLAPYLQGADASALGLMLVGVLPAGVMLDGTRLVGTPTEMSSTEVVASVDVEGC